VGGDGLDFTADGDGARVRLRVSAGASRSQILGPHGGALKLSVKAPPERGKANREVLAVVARAFGVAPSDVALMAGEASPDKLVRLPLTPAEAARRWAARPSGEGRGERRERSRIG
jgi:uncharacterized protein (TIGR00251 family)